MANVMLPKYVPCSKQPQHGFNLQDQFNHPGTLICVGDYVNQKVESQLRVKLESTPEGIAKSGNGDAAAMVVIPAQSAFVIGVTSYVMSFIYNGGSAFETISGYYEQGTGKMELVNLNIKNNTATPGALRFTAQVGSTTLQFSTSAGFLVLGKKYNVVILPRLGGNAEVWINGSKATIAYDVAVPSSLQPFASDGAWTYLTMNYFGGYGPTTTKMLLLARLQTQNFDPVAMSTNPWQLFHQRVQSPQNVTTKENRKPIIRESNMLGTSKRKLSDVNLLEVSFANSSTPGLASRFNPANKISHGIVMYQRGKHFIYTKTDRILTPVAGSNAPEVFTIGGVGFKANTTVRTPGLSGTTSNISIMGGQAWPAQTTVLALVIPRGSITDTTILVGSSRTSDNAGKIGFTMSGGEWAFRSNALYTMPGAAVEEKPTALVFVGYKTNTVQIGKLYVDGILYVNNSAIFGSGAYSDNNSITYDPTQSDILLTVYWNRILSDSEVLEVSNNPWQLFRQSSNLPLLK